jgi:glucose-6-phosphate 1-epimerase
VTNCFTLRAPDGARAEVYEYGAHVTSWSPAPGDDERLFLSARSDLSGGSAIRGGIPVIFPQFAAEGPLPRHGFARTSMWTLDDQRLDQGDAIAVFSLTDSDASRAIWPVGFRARLSVRVGGDRLVTSFEVENTHTDAISFTCALHTYLRVGDISQTQVVGLHGARYRVSSAPQQLIVDTDEIIHIGGEIDRVYVDAPPHVILREPARELEIEATGFRDLVLWNPGAKAASLPDMEPSGERRMVCIEAAAVQKPIVINPEDRFIGTQTLRAR